MPRDTIAAAAQLLRRCAHALLPVRVRDAGWLLLNAAAARRELGFVQARSLFDARHPDGSGTLRTFAVRSLQHPFTIRGGTSDAEELIHTVCRRAYACGMPPEAPRWILDLGANIGDTAAWYLSTFPSARVIAVEPDEENVGLARRNLSPYGDRAIVVSAAVWPSDGRVTLVASETNRAASRVGSPGETGAACEAVSIPTLLARYGVDRVGIMKMDIEGAEEALFNDNSDPWLEQVDMFLIEIHSASARAAVDAAAARHRFTSRLYRDVHVYRRLRRGD